MKNRIFRSPGTAAAHIDHGQAAGHGHGDLAPDGSPLPHVTPMVYYWGVFGALLFLTVVTVVISELHLPMPFSLIVAMIVAVTKAGLVASIFMHLAFDKKLNALVFGVGIGWMLIFFTFTMTDLLSRDLLCKESGIHYTQDEAWKAGRVPEGFRVADPNAAAGHGEHGGQHAAPAEGGGEHGGEHAAPAGESGH
jgi:cytochrome c oxidase subunit 4